MNNSTTADTNLLQLCWQSITPCHDFNWEMACTILNLLSFIINIFHLVVLHRMPSLKGKKYLSLLTNIGIVDLLGNICLFIQINCQLHELAYQRSRIIAAVIATITGIPLTFRYYLFALGSYDRYKAMCDALKYESNFIVNHFNMFVLGGWIFCVAVMIIRDTVFSADLCLNTVFGASNYVALAPSSLATILLLVPFIVTCGLQIRVCLEMYRIQKRQTVINDKTLFKSTLYIVIIFIEFIFCLFPVIVCYFLNLAGGCDFLITWFSILLYTLYGIMNTVTYGWLYEPYRAEVLRLFRCGRRSTRVTQTKTSGSTNREDVSTQETGNQASSIAN